MLLSHLCLAGLMALLVIGAVTDVADRRIPNWLTGSIALLYPVYALSSASTSWPGALAVASLALLVGIGLFLRDLIGGGDVKLIAALGLWAGVDHFLAFALTTTIAGGALALLTLVTRRWSGLLLAHLAAVGLNLAPAGGPAAAHSASDTPAGTVAAGHGSAAAESTEISTERPATAPVTIPYGVAIAAGGVAIILELLKL